MYMPMIQCTVNVQDEEDEFTSYNSQWFVIVYFNIHVYQAGRQ